MSALVTTHQLTKTFKNHTAVDSLDLHVPSGEIYGFLGPNGSGKSTTLKMLLGLTRPTSGGIELFGEPLTSSSRAEMLPAIGSMIEAPPGYGHLTGAENMRIVQDMLNLRSGPVEQALSTVRLQAHKDKLVRNYSLGMKQRLGIAMALAREPSLLLLDEPTNGLDPAGIEEMRELLISLAGTGITVMVSSHLLDEIDKMATTIGIIANGQMVFQGGRDALFAQSIPDLIIETPDATAALEVGIAASRELAASRQLAASGAAAVSRETTASREPDGSLRVTDLDNDQAAELVHRLATSGTRIHQVRRVQQSLEQVFMDLTGREGLL